VPYTDHPDPCEQRGWRWTHGDLGISDLRQRIFEFPRRLGQPRLEPCLVDVNSVILGMQCMLRRLISHDVLIDLQLAEEPLQARVDRFQLEQVLLNLAVNARDAMPLGGRLSFSTGGSPNRLWLRVRDTGPGIPAGILEQIFEPFFTTKEAGRGTGLGLSTVHGIVTQSEGSIQAYNNLEGGACFEVQLPRVANSFRAD
jgi:two-component system, cell cycle sensor histidine kinase and response regulator CckA